MSAFIALRCEKRYTTFACKKEQFVLLFAKLFFFNYLEK